jgi:hypothetical protein
MCFEVDFIKKSKESGQKVFKKKLKMDIKMLKIFVLMSEERVLLCQSICLDDMEMYMIQRKERDDTIE